MMFIIDLGKRLVASFAHAISDIFGIILVLVGLGLILAIGWQMAVRLARLARWLGAQAQLDRIADEAGVARALGGRDRSLDVLGMLAGAVKWLVMLVFFVAGCYALAIPFVTAAWQSFAQWLPSGGVALVVMGVGAAIASCARQAVRWRGSHAGAMLGDLAFASIVVVAAFIALAVADVPALFLIIGFVAVMLALSLGGGLAIGLGGRDAIRRALDAWIVEAAVSRATGGRDTLSDLSDPASTVVPLQGDLASFTVRDYH